RGVLRVEEGKPGKCERLSPRDVASHSSSTRFLCFGFLRRFFGSIGRAAGTVPTRSRAIAFTSLPASNRFFRANHPPHCGGEFLRRKRFGEKCNTSRRRRFELGNIHGITAGRNHTYPRGNREHLVRQLFQGGPSHGRVQHGDREAARLRFDRRQTFLGAYRG